MLEKVNVSFDIASNGLEALKKMESEYKLDKRFKLILMDLQMPEMDGITASKKICEIYKSSKPIIVALTANTYEEVWKDCKSAGFDDFLSKPINFESLKSILTKYLNEIS